MKICCIFLYKSGYSTTLIFARISFIVKYWYVKFKAGTVGPNAENISRLHVSIVKHMATLSLWESARFAAATSAASAAQTPAE
jgi:hypothetical protein